MKRNKDIENIINDPYLKIIPVAANHIILVNSNNNYIDITSDLSNGGKFYIVTKHNDYVIDENGILGRNIRLGQHHE